MKVKPLNKILCVPRQHRFGFVSLSFYFTALFVNKLKGAAKIKSRTGYSFYNQLINALFRGISLFITVARYDIK